MIATCLFFNLCLKGPASDWANEAAVDAAGVPVVDHPVVPAPAPAAMPTYQVIFLLKLNLIHFVFLPGD